MSEKQNIVITCETCGKAVDKFEVKETETGIQLSVSHDCK